jgi:histidinol dehydrogenase
VNKEIRSQIGQLSRADIIAISIDNAGGIVLVDSLDQAAELANAFAAEHLCLSVQDAQALMDKINNAGGFFLGDNSFEVLGDYVAGPSHVMPTGGSARFSSPLNVLDFVKLSSVVGLKENCARELGLIAAELAELEGLTAHAAAARARTEQR